MNVPAGTTQDIAIKNDQIMIKAAGGDKNLDLLYRHAGENVVIIDHRKDTLMTVDEQQVDRINQQAQNVQPLLKGLGEQIAKLPPDQRQTLQELLGDNASLVMNDKPAGPPAPTRLVPTGGKREVAGIRCRAMRVMQGATPCSVNAIGLCRNPFLSPLEITNCDLQIRSFFSVNSNIKSRGKRFALRLTACFKALVSTP
jgi:hypothetical protein